MELLRKVMVLSTPVLLSIRVTEDSRWLVKVLLHVVVTGHKIEIYISAIKSLKVHILQHIWINNNKSDHLKSNKGQWLSEALWNIDVYQPVHVGFRADHVPSPLHLLLSMTFLFDFGIVQTLRFFVFCFSILLQLKK
jgi:hypothetical protein